MAVLFHIMKLQTPKTNEKQRSRFDFFKSAIFQLLKNSVSLLLHLKLKNLEHNRRQVQTLLAFETKERRFDAKKAKP